jgi:hypothetical protein
VADRNTPQKPVWLARIVSMWAEGAGMTAIVRALGKTKEAAYAGVSATLSAASKGWRDASRLGRKRPLAAEMIAWQSPGPRVCEFSTRVGNGHK